MLQKPVSISVACVEFLLAKGISHKINIKSNAPMNNHLVNMYLISIAVLRLLGPKTNIKRSSKKKKKKKNIDRSAAYFLMLLLGSGKT
jgi:hypothetical protein